MRRVTIRDVAAEAGVSIGTASKALNGQGKLRTETREFRDWLAAYMADAHVVTHDELAASMGVSRAARSTADSFRLPDTSVVSLTSGMELATDGSRLQSITSRE